MQVAVINLRIVFSQTKRIITEHYLVCSNHVVKLVKHVKQLCMYKKWNNSYRCESRGFLHNNTVWQNFPVETNITQPTIKLPYLPDIIPGLWSNTTNWRQRIHKLNILLRKLVSTIANCTVICNRLLRND